MLCTTGSPTSLEAQAAKKWHHDVPLKFLTDGDDLTNEVNKKQLGLIPLWNSIYGHNFNAYRYLLNNDFKIIDEIVEEPKYYLAAKSAEFEVVAAPSELLDLTNAYWREHRSYLLKPQATVEENLSQCQSHYQFATVCTEHEATEFGLEIHQELPHQAIKQTFAVIAKDLSKNSYERLKLVFTLNDYKEDTLLMICHPFKEAGVMIDDIVFLPKINEKRELMLIIKDDYRRARMRKAFNQIADLNLAEIKILGGAVVAR